MATHSITIERFVQHKTAGWQGVVLRLTENGTFPLASWPGN